MSSFAAFLDVQGVRYPLLTYSLAIHQETDSLGRPASPTLGGTIDCVLSAPGSDQPFLIQWMFSPTMQQDGQLVLMQDVPRTTLKTISFFNAYCTGLQTRFQPGAGGGGSLQMQVRISPQRVAVGSIIHDNNWPVESHGAGQSHNKPTPPLPVQKPGYNSEDVHTALDLAGYTPLPLVGTVTGIADAALYLAEGDLGGAVLAGGGALLGIFPFGRVAGKLVVKGVKWVGRTKRAQQLLKKALGLRALYKRTINKLERKLNEGVVRAAKTIRRIKKARKLLANVLSVRALVKRVRNRAEKLIEAGVDNAITLTRQTKLGKRLIKNALAIRALEKRTESRLLKLLHLEPAKVVKLAKRTKLSKRITKRILQLVPDAVKSYVKDKVVDAVTENIDAAIRRNPGQNQEPQTPVSPKNNLPQSCYSMNPRDVKKVLDAKRNGEPYDEAQFQYYHLNRNKFNVGNKVTKLIRTGLYKFKDDLGNTWRELPAPLNAYHMPDEEYWSSVMPFATPYSRKFVRADKVSGIGGEFEMIVRSDGERIDGKTSAAFQESYNFARTLEHPIDHKHLDMDPHDKDNPGYVAYEEDMPLVTIIDQ